MRKPPLYKRLAHRAFGGEASAVFRGMAVLATGSGLAKVVGLVSMPIVARLYTPEDFGVMAVYTALVAMLLPLMTLRYVLALPLPRHDGVAMNVMVLSVGILLVIGTALTVILAVVSAPLLGLVSMEALTPWWWLIPAGLFGAGIYEVLSLWATRKRNYRVIARTSVTQTLAGNAVRIGLGFVMAGPLGLLLGQLVSQSGGIGTMLRQFGAELRANLRHVRLSRIRQVAWRHRGFPIWRVPSQFLLVLSMQAPLLLTAYLFSAAETGQLALAMTVVAVPVSLISSSTAKAFYAEASEAYRLNRNLRSLALSVAKRSFVISLIPSLAIASLSIPLLPVVLGPDWALTGVLAALLALAIAPQFVSQIVLNALPIVGRNDLLFFFNLSRVFLTVTAILVPGILDYDIVTCIAIYVIAVSLQRIGQTIWTSRILGTEQKEGVL